MKIIKLKIYKIDWQEETSFVRIYYTIPRGRKIYSMFMYRSDLRFRPDGKVEFYQLYSVSDTAYLYQEE